jgi:EAL domain-containing protein (putative c-di-GMP-specific phosphodiesterase class I)
VLTQFGVGRAGLGQLAKLRIHGVKIDQSLLSQIGDDPISERVRGAIFDVCNDLNVSPIAQGISTDQQLKELKKCGGRFVQSEALFPNLDRDGVFQFFNIPAPPARSTIAPANNARYLEANS